MTDAPRPAEEPKLWESIRERWLAAGIQCHPGVHDAELNAFEKENGVRLPEDVRSYFTAVNGMPLGAWDEEVYLRFWPLSELVPVSIGLEAITGIPNFSGITAALPDAGSYYVFADHSIGINYSAVKLTADPLSASGVLRINGGPHWKVLTPTLTGFFQRYVEDPDWVLFG